MSSADGATSSSTSTSVDWSAAKPIALVVPGDCQVDDEFWRMLAPHAIPFVSRTTGADERISDDRTAIAHLIALARSSDLEVAADRLRNVHAVAAGYVDTSISFVRGPGGDKEIAARIERILGVPTVVTSTAVVLACRALRVGRLAVLSVYTESVNAAIPQFFEPEGVRIVRIGRLASRFESGETSLELAHMRPEELILAGREIDGPDVDAVFIPCTAVRTLDAIEPLEAAIGKPVITAIQATIWAVARLAGLGADATQGGRLWGLPLGAVEAAALGSEASAPSAASPVSAPG